MFTDECAESPCLNGGTCKNQIGTFTCECRPHFAGPLCGHCEPGWTGTQCAEDIDEWCLNNPCSEGKFGTDTHVAKTKTYSKLKRLMQLLKIWIFSAVLEACNNYKILNDPLRYYTTETYANGRTGIDTKSDALVGVGSYSSSLGSRKSKDWSGRGFYRFDRHIGQNVSVIGYKALTTQWHSNPRFLMTNLIQMRQISTKHF